MINIHSGIITLIHSYKTRPSKTMIRIDLKKMGYKGHELDDMVWAIDQIWEGIEKDMLGDYIAEREKELSRVKNTSLTHCELENSIKEIYG